MCAACEPVRLRQPASPAALSPCDPRKTKRQLTMHQKSPSWVQARHWDHPHPHAGRPWPSSALPHDLLPEDPALSRVLHHPQFAGPKAAGASPPERRRWWPWVCRRWGKHLRPPAPYLLTASQLLFPACQASFGYAGCPRQPLVRGCFERQAVGRRKKRDTTPPPTANTGFFAVPVTPRRSALLKPWPLLRKSTVPLLAGGSTAPKISKFGARGSAGDGGRLGRVRAGGVAHEDG